MLLYRGRSVFYPWGLICLHAWCCILLPQAEAPVIDPGPGVYFLTQDNPGVENDAVCLCHENPSVQRAKLHP